MVVGGGYIESIKKGLLEAGVVKIYHVNGRKVGDARREIPDDVDLVIRREASPSCFLDLSFPLLLA